MKHLLILESGGKTPASNAAASALIVEAKSKRWKTSYARFGFHGLMEGDINEIDRIDPYQGGSHIGTSKVEVTDIDRALGNLKKNLVDAVAVIGGGGRSLDAAHELRELPLIYLPKSIDNDMLGTDFTIGFPSYAASLKQGISGLKRLVHDNYRRGMVVEINFDKFGWTTAATAMGGADAALIPGTHDRHTLLKIIENKIADNDHYLVAMSEFADVDGADPPKLAYLLEKRFKRQTRYQPTGLVYKTGGPSYFDIHKSTGFAQKAVQMADEGMFGHMVCARLTGMPFDFHYKSLDDVVGKKMLPEEYFDKQTLNVTKKFRDYMEALQ